MLRKLLLVSVISLVGVSYLFGQDKKPEQKYGWTKSVVANLNFTQNQFDNWTQGGENSWAWQGTIDGKINRTEPHFKWANSGKLTYGKSKIGDTAARKSADELRFESVYTRKVGIPVNPYASAKFLTQLTPGYQYFGDTSKVEISNFMDPGFFTQSVGLDYSPNDNFQTRLGAAVKETFTDQHPVPYADDPATSKIEKTKVEYGATSVTEVNAKLNQIILFTSHLDLFSNFEAFNQIDVDWDNTFTANIAKYLTVNFNIRIYYDRDFSKKRQIKQTLSAGLTYTLL